MGNYDMCKFYFLFQLTDSMNSLTQEEKTQIWIPRIIFNNTDDENESVLDRKAKVAVIRKVRK